jgi:hypothetical protein
VTVARGWAFCITLAIAWLASAACQLRRPDTAAVRLIEPQLVVGDPARAATQTTSSTAATPLRLLDTQARAHIGRRVLHHRPDGEVIQDPVWFWSSPPDRYFDTTLRLELASSQVFRPVDSPTVPTLAATLLAWQLESDGDPRLAGEVEFHFIDDARGVHTFVVRGSEPISRELPGDLAAASGRLLHRLASDGLNVAARER